MTRDLLVTPRRIAFVRSKENQLYETLMEMVVKKQDEIRAIINSMLEQLRAHVPSLVDDLEFPGIYGIYEYMYVNSMLSPDISQLYITSVQSVPS